MFDISSFSGIVLILNRQHLKELKEKHPIKDEPISYPCFWTEKVVWVNHEPEKEDLFIYPKEVAQMQRILEKAPELIALRESVAKIKNDLGLVDFIKESQ